MFLHRVGFKMDLKRLRMDQKGLIKDLKGPTIGFLTKKWSFFGLRSEGIGIGGCAPLFWRNIFLAENIWWSWGYPPPPYRKKHKIVCEWLPKGK